MNGTAAQNRTGTWLYTVRHHMPWNLVSKVEEIKKQCHSPGVVVLDDSFEDAPSKKLRKQRFGCYLPGADFDFDI
jgi:hypothetical protein